MSNSNLSIATLVGSRICHDLISPVGAIHNGIELIAMDGPLDSPELELISDSVANATARIKFFRIAFGIASGEHVLGTPEVAGIVRSAFGEGRHQARWSATGDLPRAVVQGVFLAILCIETGLPIGGEITVANDDDAFAIIGTGPRITCAPELWEPLKEARAPTGLRPEHVQFALLALASAELGRPLLIEASETEISIRF
jgi:histidine phosphotransferase ChpT